MEYFTVFLRTTHQCAVYLLWSHVRFFPRFSWRNSLRINFQLSRRLFSINKAKSIDFPSSRKREAYQKTVDRTISQLFTDKFILPCSRYAWCQTSTSDPHLFLPAMTFEMRYTKELCLSFNSGVKVDRWFIFLDHYTVNSIVPRRHVNKIFQARQTNKYFTLPRSLFSLLADGIVDILSSSLVFLIIFPGKFRY